ncbi:MAG: DUF4350 domain-containing protein [Bacteroidia bacterium]
MKSRNTIFPIAIGAVLVVVLTLVYLNLPNSSNWQKLYRNDKSDPYDVRMIYELLLDSRNGKDNHVIFEGNDHALQTRIEKSNYVFIGERYFGDSADAEHLLRFIERGNTAFIAVEQCPDFLAELLEYTYTSTDSTSTEVDDEVTDEVDSVLTEESPDSTEDSDAAPPPYDTAGFIQAYQPQSFFRSLVDSVGASTLTDSSYASVICKVQKINFLYFPENWQGVDTSLVYIKDDVTLKGKLNYTIFNYFEIKYGKGKILLHLTPINFTNYSILSEDNFDYNRAVFAGLNDGPIIWDEYDKQYRFLDKTTNEEELPPSPFRYILSQSSLKQAWYLSLALILIYFVFIGKRKQRVIPVIEPVRNTSLEFVKTVGQVYYLERNHRSICLHKIRLFYQFIKHRYHLSTPENTQVFRERLSTISGIDIELINEIFNEFTIIEKEISVEDKKFIHFHQLLTRFYKDCK